MIGDTDKLDPDYPPNFGNVVLELLQSHTVFEATLAEWIAIEFQMPTLETYTMLGRMDIRGRIDKLRKLFKARADKNGSEVVKVLEKAVREHTDNRNTVVHGFFLGHWRSQSDGEVYVQFSTMRHYRKEASSEIEMTSAIELPVSAILTASQQFYFWSSHIDKLMNSRRDQLNASDRTQVN